MPRIQQPCGLLVLAALAWNAAAFALPPRTAQQLTLYRIWDAEALCNDGTASGFYYLPANDTAKQHLWLVYLEGGQWCYDNATCHARLQGDAMLASSRSWDKGVKLGGIFDGDAKRNPWAGAHLVYLPYCSSDAWVGNAGPESNSWGFYFRGQRILEAALKQLQEGVEVTTLEVVRFPNHTHATHTVTANYSLTAADHVLFSGCSAGSRGAMFSIDSVQAMLPAGAPPVLGFFDSPLWVDLEPLAPGIVSLENETQQVFNLVNASARLGAACAAAYPGEEGWRCLYGQYRVPYIATPYLLSASQFDKFQLPYNEGSNPPYAPGPNLSYALAFQQAVRAVVLELPTRAQARSAVYSSACFKHCTSTLAYGAFWGVKVDGVSLKDFLAAWYFGSTDPAQWTSANAGAGVLPAGMSPQRIDACDGYACGQCHSETTVPAPPLPPAYAQSLLAGAPPLQYGGVSAPAAPALHRSRVLTAAHLLMFAAAVGVSLVLLSRRRKNALRARAPAFIELPPMGEEAPLLGARG